jgi:creatinine amidohydrolase
MSIDPNSEPDQISDSREKELSRRQFLGLLAAGSGAAMLSACGGQPAATAKPFEGYSIFHETMVEMAWPEIKKAADEGGIILLPVGTIEEHGPHMSLAIDLLSTYNWCKMLRPVLEARGVRTLIAPPYYWGINVKTRAYPGSFSVREETMKALLFDIHNYLHLWGFNYVFSFSQHGDSEHIQTFETAIKEAHDKLDMGAYIVYGQGTQTSVPDYVVFQNIPDTPPSAKKHLDVHAGAWETAEMLAYFPETVDTSIAKTLAPTSSFEPLGYWGDPAGYEQIALDEIRKWAESMVGMTADAIETFLKEQRKIS